MIFMELPWKFICPLKDLMHHVNSQDVYFILRAYDSAMYCYATVTFPLRRPSVYASSRVGYSTTCILTSSYYHHKHHQRYFQPPVTLNARLPMH